MNQKELDLINHLLHLREESKLNEIYAITDEYLKNNKPSIDLLLRFARLFDLPPIVDDEKSIQLAEKVLDIDSQNPYAVILLSFVYYFDTGPWEIPPTVYKKLESIHNNDSEIQSMIEYVKSWYWKNKDSQKYVDALKKSISLWDKHVENLYDLGNYYLDNNEIKMGLFLQKKAFYNIKKVYNNDIADKEDLMEAFLNNRIKGTSVVRRRYDELAKIAKLADVYKPSSDN